jgi:hypothetical protein
MLKNSVAQAGIKKPAIPCKTTLPGGLPPSFKRIWFDLTNSAKGEIFCV